MDIFRQPVRSRSFGRLTALSNVEASKGCGRMVSYVDVEGKTGKNNADF
jgi:hypothetical protein